MPQDNQEPTPPKGLYFVFAAGQRKIEEQLKSVDSLDVKMGVLVAFLGALVAAFLAALFAAEPGKIHVLLNPPSWIAWLLIGLLGLDAALVAVALVASFNAYRPRELLSGPKFSDLMEWTNEEPARIRYVFLNTLQLATDTNDKLLSPKRRNAQKASWFTLFALLSLLATAVAFVLRLKLYP